MKHDPLEFTRTLGSTMLFKAPNIHGSPLEHDCCMGTVSADDSGTRLTITPGRDVDGLNNACGGSRRWRPLSIAPLGRWR